ncbi:MAG TPA: hypothetical protein DD666_03715 [Advenella kashmirensis]|uniref:Uncharacterized protein n=1 Tax=Advenella kashmirensis TaxID=310575 RepID=A0A356LC03_9BURK|nr:hypothetical protein [Advenella kashmirensis]
MHDPPSKTIVIRSDIRFRIAGTTRATIFSIRFSCNTIYFYFLYRLQYSRITRSSSSSRFSQLQAEHMPCSQPAVSWLIFFYKLLRCFGPICLPRPVLRCTALYPTLQASAQRDRWHGPLTGKTLYCAAQTVCYIQFFSP